MDIRGWLADTIDAGVPQEPIYSTAADPSAYFTKSKPTPRSRNTRLRRTSDSSFLDTQFPAPRKLSNKRKSTARDDTDSIRCSQASHATDTEGAKSESASQRYARKPRHRPRPDRYEPAPKPSKKRKEYVHRSRKDGPRRTHRRSTQKKSEISGIGIGQSNPANVTGDRLTLRPREQLGLFNKGKASTAVRGRGLPDLVFSEMRFLQTNPQKLEIDQDLHHDQRKRKRRRDTTQADEGDISAYFNASRPPLVEKDYATNVQTRQPSSSPRHGKLAKQSNERDVPTLTFERNGPELHPRHNSRASHCEDTSYVSWSESIREPSAKSWQKQDQRKTAVKNGWEAEAVKSTEINQKEYPAHQVASLPERERESTIERFNASSLQPSSHQVSRSRSCLQRSTSPHVIETSKRASRTVDANTAPAVSQLSPTVANARSDSRSCQFRQELLNPKLPNEDEVINPIKQKQVRNYETESTTKKQRLQPDLEKALEHCKHVFSEWPPKPTWAEQSARLPKVSHSLNLQERSPEISSFMVHGTASNYRPPARVTLRPPTASCQAIYGEQIQRNLNLQLMDEQISKGRLYDNDPGYLYEDDGEQEHIVDGGYLPMMAEQHWEEDCNEISMNDDEFEAEDSLQPVVRVQRILSDNSVVAPGFWRPNKLY